MVCAGPDRVTRTLKDVPLRGVAADERDVQELTVAWKKQSGPGRVKFRDAGSLKTHVTFSKPGTYTLGLAASDGELQSQDEVTLKVGAARGRRS